MPNAKLILNDKEYEFPVFAGSENEVAIDISKLRAQTGAIAYDPGYGNVGACSSSITYIDGDAGILRYRGYPIEQLATQATFVEVCYLLIYGHLPTADELEKFNARLNKHSLVHEDMKKLFEGYPPSAHPMAIMSAMVISLSAYHPDLLDPEIIDTNIMRLLAKFKTLAAFTYKKSVGQPYVYPRSDLSYTADFLHMMFSVPTHGYDVPDVVVKALDLLLILHADHEQNCSTSTVRMVGSSQANVFASVAAGVNALWGPLHGGANQEVIMMLEDIHKDGGDVQKYVNMAKDKNSSFRLFGFGHRVYKNFDPRAKILGKAADDVLNALHVTDPLLDIARGSPPQRSATTYFIERKLYPNVDFYSGIIYRALGIPTNDVHGDVRHGASARLDRPVERNAQRPADAHQPPAPDLHGRNCP